VLDALDPARYEATVVEIGRDGRWELESGRRSLTPTAEKNAETLPVLAGSPPGRVLGEVDVVLPILHGPFGEDGTVQGLLELADVPYVGAGALASAVGMDKAAMKAVFRAHDLPVVPYLVLRDHEWRGAPGAWRRRVADELGYPCFVKPANLGSSVGISKVTAERALEAAVATAFTHDRKILVERGVLGREIEVGVLGNDEPEASVPGEVLPGREWYDYEAKYTDGIAKLLIPAPLAPALTAEFRRLAVAAFRAIDAAGLARVDFFLDADDRIWVNEINTIPGFTRFSAYPRLWEASGLPYPALVDRLIALALERHARKRRLATPAPPRTEPGGGA
jgi:D-alanine-D-alanine ligase